MTKTNFRLRTKNQYVHVLNKQAQNLKLVTMESGMKFGDVFSSKTCEFCINSGKEKTDKGLKDCCSPLSFNNAKQIFRARYSLVFIL